MYPSSSSASSSSGKWMLHDVRCFGGGGGGGFPHLLSSHFCVIGFIAKQQQNKLCGPTPPPTRYSDNRIVIDDDGVRQTKSPTHQIKRGRPPSSTLITVYVMNGWLKALPDDNHPTNHHCDPTMGTKRRRRRKYNIFT